MTTQYTYPFQNDATTFPGAKEWGQVLTTREPWGADKMLPHDCDCAYTTYV